MRKALRCGLVVAVLVAAVRLCPAAQEEGTASAGGVKPLVTVAFSGYDDLLANIDFIGKLGGNPSLAKTAEALVTLATGGQGLAGLDTKKPWGVVVQTDGQQFPILAFVPVTDLKKVLGLAQQQGIEVKDSGGTIEIATPGRPVYAKEKNGWAILADSPTSLASAPADPLKLLGELPKKYVLAVRASIKNVPPMFRQMFVAQLQMGAQSGLQQMPGESDEDYALRSNVAKQMIQQMTTMVNELDEILLGLAIDRQTGTAHLDVEITAMAGTKTAGDFSMMKPTASQFAGFGLPGAAIAVNWVGELPDSSVLQAKSSIASVRDKVKKELQGQGLTEEQLKLASQSLKDLLDVAQQTIETKKVDGAVAVQFGSGATTLVGGAMIADGAKLDKVIKRLVAAIAKEDAEAAKLITLDAETYEGVRFHTASVPLNDEEAAKVFGKTLNVVVGIGDQSIYLAVGRAASKNLKQAIDNAKTSAGKEILPRVVLALTPIARFVADVSEGQAKAVATQVAGILEQSEGKDHVTLKFKPIPNGSSTRLEVEEGVLKAIGMASQAGVGAAGGRPPRARPKRPAP